MPRFASLTSRTSLTSLYTLAFVTACASSAPSDLDLADDDLRDVAIADSGGKADLAWDAAGTLHVGERAFGYAGIGGRRVFPLWLDGSDAAPLAIDVVASAQGGGDVRVAVLGPLVDGTRATIAAAGYSSPRSNIEMTIEATERGEYLVVVGSYRLASETAFTVGTYSDELGARTDVLASPKAGALVGDASRLVSLSLGDVLADRTTDIEVELWASPPALGWIAEKVATSVASGNQVNFIVPASVAVGDDLRLVVREAGGRVIDSGVTTRFAPVAESFVRLDALLYGDLVSLGASGVVGFYEGVAEMSLRNETKHVEIASDVVRASMPGAVGMGFGAFDATFAPELIGDDGTVNPTLPRNGETVSVGWVNGNGDYVRMGCFEWCNDLEGSHRCTGAARVCPTTAW